MKTILAIAIFSTGFVYADSGDNNFRQPYDGSNTFNDYSNQLNNRPRENDLNNDSTEGAARYRNLDNSFNQNNDSNGLRSGSLQDRLDND